MHAITVMCTLWQASSLNLTATSPMTTLDAKTDVKLKHFISLFMTVRMRCAWMRCVCGAHIHSMQVMWPVHAVCIYCVWHLRYMHTWHAWCAFSIHETCYGVRITAEYMSMHKVIRGFMGFTDDTTSVAHVCYNV